MGQNFLPKILGVKLGVNRKSRYSKYLEITGENYCSNGVEINSQFSIHRKFIFMEKPSKFEVQNWELEIEIMK